MSAIFQQGLKQVLRKHCNFIASSLEVVGCGSNEPNEPVYSGLNEPVVCVAQTVDQMKSGFNALHVKSGPTKRALIFCIQGHLFTEIVIQTTQILIIN